ncbi:MAG: type IV secretion system DNA-binding domain-containing protein [Fulvimarina manganoxydans]|uniref:type IV secretion system DNA-binding domain-containing protein n=1 Tax=Fulvimarina manganoxydans TaxID=937218 RepID=UPI0023560AD2|nr:type IV secretion system DNA-binding domain-containing protein [Fulvimarina manganoxydans]MCK5934052.1 type IV secretion system DNA-binding domain-containing protein [Fulvimarina manganoxydans]
MIVHRRPTPIAWSFGAIVLGLGLSVALWFYLFNDTYWRLASGAIMHLTTDYAVMCLDPRSFFECRRLFEFNGYPDLEKVHARQAFVIAPTIVGLGCFLVTFYLRVFTTPYLMVLSGFSVGDFEDLKRQAKAETGPKGVEWFPGWRMTTAREVQSHAIVGASGSGKTNALLHLAHSVVKRGDRSIVYAYKPDMVARFPAMDPDEPYVLLAPHDARSWRWDIARDVQDEASAIRLSAHLVPDRDGDIPFFTQTARAVCTGMIMRLMRDRGTEWSWADLNREVTQPLDVLVTVAKQYYPEAEAFLSADPRQSEGTRGTLLAHLLNLKLLSIAWNDSKDRPIFSIREFIFDEGKSYPKTVIIARSGDHDELSGAWISTFVEMASDAVQSNYLSESSTRRLWFFLDEFPRLPKVEKVDDLLMTGRAKGVALVFGIQSLEQVAKRYGRESYKAWFSTIGTKICCQTQPGEGAHDLASMFGKTRIREKKITPTATGSYDAGNEREEEPFTAFDFATNLNVHRGTWHKMSKTGIDVLVTGVGPVLSKILVPFVSEETYRADWEPADWLEEGRQLMRERETTVANFKQQSTTVPGAKETDDLPSADHWIIDETGTPRRKSA